MTGLDDDRGFVQQRVDTTELAGDMLFQRLAQAGGHQQGIRLGPAVAAPQMGDQQTFHDHDQQHRHRDQGTHASARAGKGYGGGLVLLHDDAAEMSING